MSIFKNGVGDYNEHEIVHDVELGGGAKLHRYTNNAGVECSAIYIGYYEVWWHYRSEEDRMIDDWRKLHGT